MNILGIRIDNFSKKEILQKIEFFLTEDKFHQIATINPEFVLKAQNNKQFKSILNSCDLNVADGIGIFFAFLRFGKLLKCHFPGIDLMNEILKIAVDKNLEVFLAVSNKGLSKFQEVKKFLLKIYPDLNISGSDIDPYDSDYKLPSASYKILFCNFGAPDQEIFINSLKNANIRIAMGVGGSFDFVTGKTPRAPKFMQKIGLEWLFRLGLEPQYRLKRVFRAVIVFPVKILLKK